MILSYTKKNNKIDTTKLISSDLYKDEYQFFWENNKSKKTIIAFGCISAIEIFNSSDLNSIQTKIENQLNTIIDISEGSYIPPKFFGGYAFDIKIKSYNNWGDFPRGYFILPKCIITSSKNDTSITLIKKSNSQLDPQVFSKEINNIYKELIKNKPPLKITNNKIMLDKTNQDITKSNYVNMINKIINTLKLTSVKKVVLSRSKYLKFEKELNLFKIIKKLRKSYPECINFFIKLPEKGIFFGSTPERLIKKDKSLIMTEAIAGTIKRGSSNEIDKLLENKLKNDSKNLGEHQLVVKEIQNILKSKLLDIKISKKPNIFKLKNVQHLITNITGELKSNISILELVKILHPTPAVSGYPVNEALKLINEYEKYDRGWYSGPIGWLDKSGDGDFCVALRSALINKKSIQLFSGGGIVLNSNPEEEWEETELKLKTIIEIIKENMPDD